MTTDGTYISIESLTYGTRSEVNNVGGSAAAVLGFAGSETSRGRDVAGYFIVDGETETATGNGRVLVGDADNDNTSGLQVKVTLNDSQVSSGFKSNLTVTRGFASQLDSLIEDLLDDENGRIKVSDDAFSDQIESIDGSIERLNALFELKQQQLISEFVAIETTISDLRNTSAFLSSQLATTTSFGGLS